MAAQLDPSQQAVLDLADDLTRPDASAVVVGAPGSGKTETLVAFAADRVARGIVAADELLVLAGSRRTAALLRDRLARELGTVTTGSLARTASSLAWELATAQARSSGWAAPRLLTGAEQDAAIRELLAGHLEDSRGPAWPEPLGPAVRRLPVFRTELRELLARATEFGLAPAALRRVGAEQSRPEWVAAADFAEEYQAVLASARGDVLDPAELGAAGVQAIEAGQLGERLGGVRLLLVDELQEATETTMRMIAAFAGRGVAVVGFGDPDIAGNGFRGGAADAVGGFRARIGPATRELVLQDVHRHGPSLRTAVAAVTGRIGSAGEGRQRAARAAGADAVDPVVSIIASGRTELVTAIARELRERHLLDGVPFSDLVVVARSGAAVPELARALTAAGVPTRTLGGDRALRDERAANALLRLVDVALDAAKLDGPTARELLLGPYGGFDAVGLRRLRAALRVEELAAGRDGHGDDLIAEGLRAPGGFATIDHHLGRRAAAMAQLLDRLRTRAREEATAEELLWEAWSGSGVADDWRERALGTGIVAEEAGRALDAVVALFASARRSAERAPDRPAAAFFADMLGADLPEDSLAPRASDDAVLVATPAGVAGVEADTVVVTGLQEGQWPNLRLRGSLLAAPRLAALLSGAAAEPHAAMDERRAVLGDELRLFALATSRARSRLVLAAIRGEDDAPSPLLAVVGQSLVAAGHVEPADADDDFPPRRDPVRPPLELRGMVGRLRRLLAASVAKGSPDRAAAAALAALAAEGVDGAAPAQWRGLAPATTEAPLWDLGDPEVLVNVSPSKLESVEEASLEWFVEWLAGSPGGFALHFGTILHAALETVGVPDQEALWAAVEPRFDELVFDSEWERERQKRLARDQHIPALAEYLRRFQAAHGVLVSPEQGFTHELPPARLSGKIDRIEAYGREVSIVDLKTGNDVGKAGAQQHAQLAAYQVAYVDGALDSFIEPVLGTDHELGDVKLVFTKAGNSTSPYVERAQPRLDEAGLEAFRERIRAAAREMASGRYRATLHDGGSDDVRRVHLPGEVPGD